jgi:hypothetical protein
VARLGNFDVELVAAGWFDSSLADPLEGFFDDVAVGVLGGSPPPVPVILSGPHGGSVLVIRSRGRDLELVEPEGAGGAVLRPYGGATVREESSGHSVGSGGPGASPALVLRPAGAGAELVEPAGGGVDVVGPSGAGVGGKSGSSSPVPSGGPSARRVPGGGGPRSK